jgi:hypothetical protein
MDLADFPEGIYRLEHRVVADENGVTWQPWLVPVKPRWRFLDCVVDRERDAELERLQDLMERVEGQEDRR